MVELILSTFLNQMQAGVAVYCGSGWTVIEFHGKRYLSLKMTAKYGIIFDIIK
jgi:hypothetical protein